MNQLYVYLYPLFFGFPSHLGHHRDIKNLRYADDTPLMAESEEEQKSLLMKVKKESENLA